MCHYINNTSLFKLCRKKVGNNSSKAIRRNCVAASDALNPHRDLLLDEILWNDLVYGLKLPHNPFNMLCIKTQFILLLVWTLGDLGEMPDQAGNMTFPFMHKWVFSYSRCQRCYYLTHAIIINSARQRSRLLQYANTHFKQGVNNSTSTSLGKGWTDATNQGDPATNNTAFDSFATSLNCIPPPSLMKVSANVNLIVSRKQTERARDS